MDSPDYAAAQDGSDAAPHPVKMHGGEIAAAGASISETKAFKAKATKLDNACCFSTPFDVLCLCNRCFLVSERQEMVELFFGSYHGTITKPGCYCRSSICTEFRKIGTQLISFDLKNTKVLDLRGSPIMVSGIVTYQVVDARTAAIDVHDCHQYVRDQAPAVLKRVVSQFPYESADSNIACLRTETSIVADRMRDVLQQRLQVAGVHIDSFSINELSYAPEIAQAMLRRQQAEALVSARRAIMQGAKEIATDAVNELSISMPEEKKCQLLSNLLLVLVSDKDITPTMNVLQNQR